MKKIIIYIIIFSGLSCRDTHSKLPYLGNPVIEDHKKVYPVVSDFAFIDQDSNIVNNQTFAGKIYVTDFVFLSCPSICPKMTREMLNIYKHFQNDERVLFLSHTIDPERDTIPRLKSYAQNLGVLSSKWHFVTGNQDSIFHLAEKSYYSTAYPDSTAPGGFTHSGGLLLIDKDRHIRGVYNGTDADETSRLINDITILLKE